MGEPWPERGSVVLVRLDHVYDECLVSALLEAPDGTILAADEPRRAVAARVTAARAEAAAALLVAESGCAEPPDGFVVVGPAELGSSYNAALRKREAPYLLPLTPDSVAAVEWRMFRAVYKGVTDFATKWLWPVPACWVTKRCAERGVAPNTVTGLSLVLVLVALWLFAQGHLATGLVLAWLMTFLDTVDGKLARLTLTSSPFGNVFDHGIDLVHPPFWWAAWWYGLSAWSEGVPLAAGLETSLWIVVVGYVVGRLMEGLFLALFRIDIHTWMPVDSWFRLFTARRNPNLALLTVGTACGRPDLGFVAVAAWTAASLVFHGVRIVQALALRLRGEVPSSWLEA